MGKKINHIKIDNIIGLFDDNYDIVGGAKSKQKKTQKNPKRATFNTTQLYLYNMSKPDYPNTSNNTSDNNTSVSGKVDNQDKYMKTLLIPLKNSNTVTVGIFIKAGSRQETEAYGIAHFLEHMTFKGTHKRNSKQLMTDLDSIGANYNAMTGHEFTLYYISGNPNDINKLLEIVIDLYLDPIYPDGDIETERNVVLEEFRMNQDNNHRKLSLELFKQLFEGVDSTLAIPIIGYKETIENFNRNQIISYRNANYMGSNCLLCVSGNFSKSDIINIIESNFKAKLKQTEISPDLFKDKINTSFAIKTIREIKPNCPKHIHIPKDINQTIINIVFNSYNVYNKNNVASDLICDILSNGFSSRLFNLLRNKLGVSYYNSSFTRAFSDVGHFIISVGVRHDSVVKTIQEILNELKNMRDNIEPNELKYEEIEKVQKQNETGLLFQFKDPYEYLMYYGMRYLTSRPLSSLNELVADIYDVQIGDIEQIIKNTFRSTNLLIGSIGNVSASDSEKIIRLVDSF
jgi:predicted Zn-dependent peptidase